jgi:hypothetical protein
LTPVLEAAVDRNPSGEIVVAVTAIFQRTSLSKFGMLLAHEPF